MPDYLVVDPSDAHNICYTTKDKSEARRRAQGGLVVYEPSPAAGFGEQFVPGLRMAGEILKRRQSQYGDAYVLCEIAAAKVEGEIDLCHRVLAWNRSHTGLMPIMPGSELEVVRKILEMMGGAE